MEVLRPRAGRRHTKEGLARCELVLDVQACAVPITFFNEICTRCAIHSTGIRASSTTLIPACLKRRS